MKEIDNLNEQKNDNEIIDITIPTPAVSVSVNQLISNKDKAGLDEVINAMKNSEERILVPSVLQRVFFDLNLGGTQIYKEVHHSWQKWN